MMQNLRLLDQYRLSMREVYGYDGDATCGAFSIPSKIDGQHLRVIASAGEGWDHVSVSRADRCPNWPEMEQIKRLFFKDDEVAMQLHVPPSEHINFHPYCLHLWRPHDAKIPMPPDWMVGPKQKERAG